MTNSLKDKFGRNIRYLRISVTDRCNFKCKYCMPTHKFNMMNHDEILTYEDILFAANIFSELGVEKVRVTGGEPLVRKGILDFLNGLNDIKTIKEVTLTTNGSPLKKMAKDLRNAGVNRINVSLDSLRPERYKDITGGFDLERIIDGINEAKKAGIHPVKTNCVIIRDFNDDEILDFCEFSKEYGIVTRFIEFMPIGNSTEWNKSNIMTGKEILEIIKSKYEIIPQKKYGYDGPAEKFDLKGGGQIGIITPISNHFCNECDKLRLTSDGKIRPCLLSDAEIDIADQIKSRDRDATIKAIAEALGTKEEEHKIVAGCRTDGFKRTMSRIGG